LKYGADIVYGEELVDKAVAQTTRVVNEVLGTIDFVRKSNNTILYRTCKEDYPTVFQIGSNDAVNALKAAEIVSRDVDGIDLNMGCPKHFSVHAGMGAALMSNPDTVKDILSTLVKNLPNPISCKIRLKSTTAETIDLLKLVESTGVKAVAIHCRTIPERPRDNAHWDILKEIVDLKPINIPIIANGDVFVHDDIRKIREMTGIESVMIVRGAIKNTSIFQNEEIPVYDVMKEYMKFAISTDNHYANTKYTLQRVAKEHGFWQNNGEGPGQVLYKGKSTRVFAELFKLEDYYDQIQKELSEKRNFIGDGLKEEDGSVGERKEEQEPPRKKQKILQNNTRKAS